MSDTSSAYPPPPPPNVPPPQFQASTPGMPVYRVPPGYQVPAGFQGPTAPDYVPPYRQAQPQAQPFAAAGVAFGSPGAILYQFGGPALPSIIAGVVAVALPFVAGRYFVLLPIFGALSGFRAMQRGRFLGGIVGIGVNILGGLISLWASGLIG